MVSSPSPAGSPRSGWDFTLIVVTLGLLGLLGVQSLIGTGYTWWAQRTIPNWEQTGYAGFVSFMNLVAAPLIVGLVIAMGLCVPKRLFDRRTLAWASVGLLVPGVVAWVATGRPGFGLGIYLVLACVIQLAVVVMTLAGASSLTYLTEGRVTRVGSGLLHMGFLLFALVVVALGASRWMLPVFYASAVLVTVGTALSFYANTVSQVLVRGRAGDNNS